MIVTKESLVKLLQDERLQQHVVGRALVALFDRQTRDEQATNDTRNHNTVGFSGADAKSGSLTAKFYLKHQYLEPWMVERWVRPSGKSQQPRLCKYVRQLNEIAAEKAARRGPAAVPPGDQNS